MTQDTALSILKTGVNVFLTGEPGSGKTHTVNEYVAYLRAHDIEPAITASTGIAATHIGGMTIHSWAGIGIKQSLSEAELDELATRERLVTRLKKTQVLIIDEISMLSAATFVTVDKACRALRRNDLPFGGLQVVLVGDFFQLPPISRGYDGPAQFAYHAPSWRALNPVVCYLSEQHRQGDDNLRSLLAEIRTGSITDEAYEVLSSCRATRVDAQTTELFAHNQNVDTVNDKKLEALPGNNKIFNTTSRGNKTLVEQLIRGCLSPEMLALKKGARVMFTKNNFEGGYVNGTLGDVVDFGSDGFPIVETLAGRRVVVEPADWTITDGDKALATITQLPLRLAWAITIHKSQGMTLDAAVIDLSRAFEYGQGYVALSRVRALSGLVLLGYNDRALRVHPEVLDTDAHFRSASFAAEATFGDMPKSELRDLHEKFVRASGGSFGEAATHARKIKEEIRAEKAPGATYKKTLALLKEGKGPEEIARERGVTLGTILSHIEKLFIDEDISSDDVLWIVPKKVKEGLQEIHTAFADSGADKLAPVFEMLDGRFSYEEIRLARLLLPE